MAAQTVKGKRRTKKRSGGFLTTGIIVVGTCLGFLGYSFVTNQLSGRSSQPETAFIAVPQGVEVRVDVRNGSSIAGLAGKFTMFLRDRDFDVVESGNFKSNNVKETYIINRSGNDSLVVLLAQALDIPESRIKKDIDAEALLDATVVIGQDYMTLKPFEQEAAEAQ